jgi:5-methylthioribose kinase
MDYYKLDERSAIDYIRSIGLFDRQADLWVSEIGDGNINMVFRVTDGRTSLILKQAYPYVRCVGESWPLSLDRIRVEADAMEVQSRYVPDLVPQLHHRDDALALMVMEDLSRLGVMRQGMIRMRKYPKFAEHVARFLADMSFYTSDFYLSGHEKKRLVARFMNPDLCKITEDLIFTDPYYDADRNNINPALRPYLQETFWKKVDLRREAAAMKYQFLTEAECLLHGDLHTGSIFADEAETKVFDAEFAFVGPMGFDIGLLLGNILINYLSWSGKDEPQEAIHDYRQHLSGMIEQIWTEFRRNFEANWDKDARDIIAGIPGFRDRFLAGLLTDTLGYAAAAMIRRMHGLAHNVDVDGIEDLDRRRDVQVRVLELAEEVMMKRGQIDDIREVIAMAGDAVAVA